MPGVAPVCHISPDEAVANRGAIRFPTVPAAVDLASALVAIAALKQIVMQLAGLQPLQGVQGIRGSVGITGAVGAQGAPGDPGRDAQTPKGGRFIEDPSQRATQTVRVYQNNDPSTEVWVDVKQINKIVWQDKVTGELIMWGR